MKKLLPLILILFAAPCFSDDKIVFQCSWQDKKPIDITVDPSGKTATRSDSDKKYNVIKLTKYAVWLEVDEPSNEVGIAIQMIVRGATVNSEENVKAGNYIKAGTWTDVIFSMTGSISPISGGQCWEQ